MKYELIIVRYGEIGLKAKETRKRFENTLVNNIKKALDTKQISSRIKKEWGRLYVYANQIDKSVFVLQKVFGITSISPAIHTHSDIDSISKLSTNISKETLQREKSFALRITRTGEHDYTSHDVAVRIGNDIVKATQASVNLTQPDFELFIEIRGKNAYLFTEKIRGTGGLPLGTQGKTLALIDGPKSLLAAWYLLRRGCKIFYVNFYESNDAVLNSFITNWYADSDIFIINPKAKNFFANLNKIASEKKCDAIATDHSLYDNSLHALSDIKLLKTRLKFPLLFPLISIEKSEINKKCEELGIPI
ncbi:MAG: THUMP domain-containing protein [Atribacterota bacterium]